MYHDKCDKVLPERDEDAVEGDGQYEDATSRFSKTLERFSRDFGKLWKDFGEILERLWETLERFLRDFFGEFNEFLKQVHTDDDSVPSSLAELQNSIIRVVITDAQDPDSLGTFIQWRIAFYCAGKPDQKPLENLMLLLDDFSKSGDELNQCSLLY